MSNHILAIGISKHQQAYNNLSFAAKDAEDFYSLFVSNVGSLGYKKILLDSEATLAQIRSALGQELTQAVKPDDSFFFFYSGHGTTALDDNGSTLAHYLVPFDATRDIASSCISVSYLQKVFQHIPSKAKIIFIDSCFSGAIHNAKGFDTAKKKSVQGLRSFASTISGTGQATFTACKDSEEAIEDLDNKHGLFTHFLLSEISKNRADNRFSIVDITTSIQEDVAQRASQKYKHTQTPTFSGHLEGPIYLPVFVNQILKEPYLSPILEVARLSNVAFPIHGIDVEAAELEKVVDNIVDIVIRGQSSPRGSIIFERICQKSLRHIKDEWQRIYLEVGADINKIPWAISELETATYQFFLLGGAMAAFGTDVQMRVYGKCLIEILKMGQNQSGLVALLSCPEVLVAEINYVVGVVTLERDRLSLLRTLLLTPVIDDRREDAEVSPLIIYTHIYYTDSLGRTSPKINDHIREFIKKQTWLPFMAPNIEGQTDNYQLRVNFLLVLMTLQFNDYLWPDFARFDAGRIKPLVVMIKNDLDCQKKVAELLGVKQSELIETIKKHLDSLSVRGLGNYWWNSIRSGFFNHSDKLP